MTSLWSLMQREDTLIKDIDRTFNRHVDLSYILDESHVSGERRQELEQQVKDLESKENDLKAELEQVRRSMNRYIIKLLEK